MEGHLVKDYRIDTVEEIRIFSKDEFPSMNAETRGRDTNDNSQQNEENNSTSEKATETQQVEKDNRGKTENEGDLGE